ncbi:glycosyltransferase family 4 protein [Leekyejoonella antrihumi]|uniref:Undecaprenyl/decaprenyl-phosphate alpha-N-acetylglucosaminyl 1-phosphate transferase n=1 Tax=Leekyejoonella antrihumi TaxID=1660198 RepID=A0A563E1T8_9MICO|nr:MraY family glycosyltransferase [Leekyejoonella antrihumi]TWP36508.1 undecaprenyl/decaprenyl-phosphate alpha-N-acetylglucosaminyl 1-phosphate transferase [Leekyejoonella antrihumi]
MREYLLICIIAGVVTFVTTPAIRWAAIRFGAVTAVRGRDVHSVPIPRLGGVAMLLGFGAAELVASRLPYLSGLFDGGGQHQLISVLIGAALITALGAVDDFRGLDPITKLAGQILAAGVMAYGGVLLVSLPIANTYTVLPEPVLVGLTIFIVLAMTNAVNFADGLDGLAAGFVAIAATAFFLWAYTYAQLGGGPGRVFSGAAFISAATIGCCLGFLPHNFHPAKLFMGDAGALLLGLLVAASTISMTGNFDPSQASSTHRATFAFWLPIVLPLLILALPVLDVILAIIRRGPKFWRPDAKHLHHRMLQMGHPHRRAVLLLYLWSASVAMGVLSFSYVSAPIASTILVVMLAVSFLLTWGLPRWSSTRRL